MQFNEDWTAEFVGQMHKYKISNDELAAKCGYTPGYTSMVLNGRKEFSSDKAKEDTKGKMLEALKRLIEARKEGEGNA
ncbi:MAG: hypothetical protein IKP31_01295 [Lachnospiraceae bacterium]|nr:hypothetical protein [Lachnospiraceae bacterium]MBR4718856.1 hypothetical protein [Lachnospiraceae bacterium]